MNHKACIIGLGVMGQRMLNNMARYAGFDAVIAWDPDAEAGARIGAQYPQIEIAGSAEAAISHEDIAVVYIACPPQWHREHALAALAVGKAVYCEKPLGVDLAQSHDLTQRAKASGLVNIVNFSLASAVATTRIETWLARGAAGEIAGVDIVLHFSQWPRAWQMDAASWLSYRAEGGFVREVLSHWLYLSHRLFGRASLERAAVHYPDGDDERAETHLLAALSIGTIPVSVMGSVGGRGPDRVEYTIWGSDSSRRIHDWNQLSGSDGAEWVSLLGEVQDPREAGYELQLANAAAAVAGKPHSMPDFEEALAVQALVESILHQ